MQTNDFEDKLRRLPKPEVGPLKHQDLLAGAIARAKNRSVLSGWWLGIPLYIFATLVMKSLFGQRPLLADFHAFKTGQNYASFLFFFVLPMVFTVINGIGLRTIYFLSGNPKIGPFLQAAWFNVLLLLASLFILIVYAL